MNFWATELRRAASTYAALEERMDELEREMIKRLDQHDVLLAQIFEALRQLIAPPPVSDLPRAPGPRSHR